MRRALAIILTTALCCPCEAAFTYYRTITVDHTKVPSNQSNFAVLVATTTASLATVANGGKVQSTSGYDVGFYTTAACDVSSKMAWETELWTASSGLVVYWVKNSSLSSSSDTVFYLCYGDGSIGSDQSNKTAVWDSDYAGVWHFPDGSTLGLTDSTSNSLTLTNNNTVTATAGANPLDGAAGKFNGTNQYLSNASGPVFVAGSSITVSFWQLQTTADLQAASVFTIGNHETPDRIQAHAPYSDDTVYWDYGDFNSGGRISTSYASQIDKWSYVVLRFDAATTAHTIFLDGASANTANSSNAPTITNTGINIGAWFGNSIFAKTKLDEFRVSHTARSADWITTEYNSQSNPNAFFTVGAETALAGAAAPAARGLSIR